MEDETGQSPEPLEFLDEGELDLEALPPLASLAPLPLPLPPPLPPRMFPPPPPFGADFPGQDMHMGYAGPMASHRGRPGILVFIGIAGLVLAVLSLLMNVGSLPMLMTQSRRATVAARRNPAPPPPPAVIKLPPPTIAPYTGDLHAPLGFARSDRDTVIGVIDSAHPLTVQRKELLNRLLGECGSQIFPTLHSPLTGDAVKAAITESEHLPDWPNVVGADYFKTSAGTVVLNHIETKFVPADGSAPLSIEGDIVTSAGGKSRSAVAIVDELNALHQALGPNFNALQAAALAKERGVYKPGPTPGDVYFNEPDPPGHRQNCMLGNTVQYTAPEVAARHVYGMGSGPFIWILPNGQVLENPWDCDPATGLALPPPTRTLRPTRPQTPAVEPATAELFLIDAGVGSVLAILLAVISIMMLAGSSVSARAMMGWGWLKLMGIVFGASTTAMAASDLAGKSALPPVYAATIYVGVATFLALPSTIVALALIRGRTIREYYETVGSCVTVVSPAIRRKLWPAIARFFGGKIGGAILLLLLTASIALAIEYLLSPEKRLPQLASISTLIATFSAIGCGFTAVVCIAFLWIARRDARLARRRPVIASALVLLVGLISAGVFNSVIGLNASANDTTQPAAAQDTPENHARMLALVRKVDLRRVDANSSDLRKQIEQGDFQVFSFFSDPDPVIRLKAVRGVGYPDMLNKLHIKLTDDARASLTRAAPSLAEMVHGKDARAAQLAGVWLGFTEAGYAAELELLHDPDQLVIARALSGLHLRKIPNAKLSHRLAELLPGVLATNFDSRAAPGYDENDMKGAAWTAELILHDLPAEDQITACFGILATGNDPKDIALRSLLQIQIRQPELMPLFYAQIGHGNMGYANEQMGILNADFENYPDRVKADFAKMIGGTDPWVRRGAILMSARAKIPVDPALLTLTDAESKDPALHEVAATSVRLGGLPAFNHWNEQAIFGNQNARAEAKSFLQRGAIEVTNANATGNTHTPPEMPWLRPIPNPPVATTIGQVGVAVSKMSARGVQAVTVVVGVLGSFLLVLLMSLRTNPQAVVPQ